MTDAQHIEAAKRHVNQLRASAKKQSDGSDKLLRMGRVEASRSLFDASAESASLADSLERVIAMAESAQELEARK